MSETTDLASSIGLSTRQEAAFKGMPLTNFATKSYQINANNDRLEAERKRKEAELEKQLMEKINVTGKFDKISAPKIQKSYAQMVMNRGYTSPQSIADFNALKQTEEIASESRKAQSELLNKNDFLIEPKVKSALITNDLASLEAFSKDPRTGVVKDDYLPDTYTLLPEARIPRITNIAELAQKSIPTSEAYLDNSKTKLIRTVGGKKIYGTPIKDNVLNQVAIEFLSNPVNARNWQELHQQEIARDLESGSTIEQALVNSFKNKNRFIEKDTYTPSKGDNGGVFSIGNGGFQSKTGWKATNNGQDRWLLNNVSPSGVGIQLIRVTPAPVAQTETINGEEKQIYKEGKPLFTKQSEQDVMLRPVEIKYLGGDKWEMRAEDDNDNSNTYETTSEALNSVVDEKLINSLKSTAKNKKYKPAFESAKSYFSDKAPQKEKQKVAKLSSIKSKLGTKGFEGYTEKELIDYYKSQGYTVE